MGLVPSKDPVKFRDRLGSRNFSHFLYKCGKGVFNIFVYLSGNNSWISVKETGVFRWPVSVSEYNLMWTQIKIWIQQI